MLGRRTSSARGPRRRGADLDRTTAALRALELPPAVFKTCPWEPRASVELGLRQWLRCAGAALRDGQVIGMPSRAVDEAWHGFILCTARYAAFCDAAYGRFLHHHPEGGEPPRTPAGAAPPPMDVQLANTVVAWSHVATAGEECVLWDLDAVLGLDAPWGIPASRVEAIELELAART